MYELWEVDDELECKKKLESRFFGPTVEFIKLSIQIQVFETKLSFKYFQVLKIKKKQYKKAACAVKVG